MHAPQKFKELILTAFRKVIPICAIRALVFFSGVWKKNSKRKRDKTVRLLDKVREQKQVYGYQKEGPLRQV